jgi:hypothetical protein
VKNFLIARFLRVEKASKPKMATILEVNQKKVLLTSCAKFLAPFTIGDPDICKYTDDDAPTLTLSYDYSRQDEIVNQLDIFGQQNNCMYHCDWTDDDNSATVVIELIPITTANASSRCHNCYSVCENYEICDRCEQAGNPENNEE